jgi:hypothetical protein
MRYVHRILIAVVFLSAGCKAQNLSKSFVEISTGAGIPVGVFASKANSIESGLAMNGFVINLEYNYYFRPKLGFCLGLKRSVFPVDVDAWTNSNPTISATSEPWRALLVYGGFASRKRLSDKTILSAKAAIGLATSKYPETTVITHTNSNPVETNFISNTGKAPAFIVGTSMKYNPICTNAINVATCSDT